MQQAALFRRERQLVVGAVLWLICVISEICERHWGFFFGNSLSTLACYSLADGADHRRQKTGWGNETNSNNGRSRVSRGNILQVRAEPSLLELCRAQLDIHGIKEMQKLISLS